MGLKTGRLASRLRTWDGGLGFRSRRCRNGARSCLFSRPVGRIFRPHTTRPLCPRRLNASRREGGCNLGRRPVRCRSAGGAPRGCAPARDAASPSCRTGFRWGRSEDNFLLFFLLFFLLLFFFLFLLLLFFFLLLLFLFLLIFILCVPRNRLSVTAGNSSQVEAMPQQSRDAYLPPLLPPHCLWRGTHERVRSKQLAKVRSWQRVHSSHGRLRMAISPTRSSTLIAMRSFNDILGPGHRHGSSETSSESCLVRRWIR